MTGDSLTSIQSLIERRILDSQYNQNATPTCHSRPSACQKSIKTYNVYTLKRILIIAWEKRYIIYVHCTYNFVNRIKTFHNISIIGRFHLFINTHGELEHEDAHCTYYLYPGIKSTKIFNGVKLHTDDNSESF